MSGIIHKVFAVRDTKVEAFLPPFTARTVGQAVRMVSDFVNQPDHVFCRHVSDYTLYEIGTFDEGSAVLSSEVRVVGPLVNFKIGGDK